MDPIRRSPYRPAALRESSIKGLTEDRIQSRAQRVKKTLALWTATTEVQWHEADQKLKLTLNNV
jgi:hypothetical protein